MIATRLTMLNVFPVWYVCEILSVERNTHTHTPFKTQLDKYQNKINYAMASVESMIRGQGLRSATEDAFALYWD